MPIKEAHRDDEWAGSGDLAASAERQVIIVTIAKAGGMTLGDLLGSLAEQGLGDAEGQVRKVWEEASSGGHGDNKRQGVQ